VADFNPRTNPISLGGFMGSHETMQRVHTGATNELADYVGRASAVRNSPRKYADPGVERQRVSDGLKTEAAKTMKTGAMWQGLIDSAKQDAAQTENALGTSKPKTDPVSISNREMVIQHFAKLPPAEKIVFVQEAIGSGDVESLQALVTAPMSLRLVDPSVRAAIEESIMMANDPEAYTSLVDMKQAIESAQMALDRLLGYVKADAGIASAN